MFKYIRSGAIIAGLVLTLSVGVFSNVEARQGCGYGRHYCYKLGICVPNGTICQQRWYKGPRYIPATGRYIP